MPDNVTTFRVLGGGLLSLLVVAAALAFAASRAEAHGVQVVSDPAPNAQLAETPERISVTFSEPIEPAVSTILLWDQSAEQLPLGELEFPSSTEMAVHVPSELPPGIYTAIWRNLSTVDGHTWAGSFTFTILGPGGEVPGGVAPMLQGLAQLPSNSPSALESAARWVVLLGSAVMLGGAAYVLFVVFPSARVLSSETNAALRELSRTVLLVTAAIGAFLILEGSLLQLIVQAEKLGGLGRVDELLVDTRLGHYLLARQGLLLIAFVMMGVVWRARGERNEIVALGLLLVTSFGIILTQSLVSHAAASDGPFWTTSIDLLHLFAGSLWVGGLIHIGLTMPRWLDELQGAPRTLFAAESFRRFSILAAVSVVLLLASGILSALVQFTSWDELWSTNYGWSLIGKMAVMLPLLAVAALNAFILQPRVVAAGLQVAGGAGDDAGVARQEEVGRLQRLLANTVRAEAVLGIAVLVAVAVLIQLQSPRTAADAAEQAAALSSQSAQQDAEHFDFEEANEVDGLIVLLHIEPAQLGQNEFEVGLGSEFGNIGEVLDVQLEFSHPDTGEDGSSLPLPLFGSARFLADGSNMSLPGEWTITANIRRRGEDDVRASFTVSISEPAASAVADSGESDSLWQWPFDGGRSTGAIATLAVVGVGAAGWGLWRLRRPT
ncbi:MAG: copper resistance protein CopC/CopD [Chloroflexi bacterium]|nr:copper resistance protein CopC/CopD [Chloroflexota bacterium]